MLLELSHYLENYLLPFFDPATATDAHVLSIVALVNEKCRENVPAWDAFAKFPDAFGGLLDRVVKLLGSYPFTMYERTQYLLFFVHVFRSIETDMVRRHALRLLTLYTWHALSPGRLRIELHD